MSALKTNPIWRSATSSAPTSGTCWRCSAYPACWPRTGPPEALDRDILVMLALTLALFVMGRSMQTHGIINRVEGTLLLTCFVATRAGSYGSRSVAARPEEINE